MFTRSNLILGLSLLALPLTAATAAAKPAAGLMTMPALQSRAVALGIQPTEYEIKGRLAEIEGTDAQGRKVELTIDRQTGEVLNREFDK